METLPIPTTNEQQQTTPTLPALFVCQQCQKSHNTTPQTHDNFLYCDDCFDRNFTTCLHCDNIFHLDDTITSDHTSKTFCNDCYSDLFFECYNCGDETSMDNRECNDDGKEFCESCYNDAYFRCEGCENEIEQRYYAEDGYCQECADSNNGGDSDNEDRDSISPKLNRFCNIDCDTTNTKKLPLSVEIEAERGDYNDAYNAIVDLSLGAGVCTDGSLDDSGIEVQTSPALITQFETNTKLICKALADNNYEATKSTGLHLHIGLKGTKDHQLLNIIKFCSAIEKPIFSLVSPSRRDNHYCKSIQSILSYHKIKDKTNLIPILQKYYARGDSERIKFFRTNKTDLKTNYNHEKYQESRYYWLNIHSFFYRNTIEIRLHNGTLNPAKITAWARLWLYIINYAKFCYNPMAVDYIASLSNSPLFQLKALLRIIKAPKKLSKTIIARYSQLNP